MTFWLYNLIWTNKVATVIYLIVGSLVVTGIVAGSVVCSVLNRKKKEKNQ